MLTIQVKLLRPDAKMPTRAHATDAGLDLYAAESCELEPHKTQAVRTGVALAIPEGWYGQIRDRSSLAFRGVTVGGGVLDASYRGEVRVLLTAHDTRFLVLEGTRVGQITIHPVPEVELIHVSELAETERGEGGFGSTGV